VICIGPSQFSRTFVLLPDGNPKSRAETQQKRDETDASRSSEIVSIKPCANPGHKTQRDVSGSPAAAHRMHDRRGMLIRTAYLLYDHGVAATLRFRKEFSRHPCLGAIVQADKGSSGGMPSERLRRCQRPVLGTLEIMRVRCCQARSSEIDSVLSCGAKKARELRYTNNRG